MGVNVGGERRLDEVKPREGLGSRRPGPGESSIGEDDGRSVPFDVDDNTG